METLLREIADVRVAVARLETHAEHTSSWIEAHRQRTTVLEDAARSRFDRIDRRQEQEAARLSDVSHHLKANIAITGENRERIKQLEAARAIPTLVQALMPVLLVVLALAYKVDLSGYLK